MPTNNHAGPPATQLATPPSSTLTVALQLCPDHVDRQCCTCTVTAVGGSPLALSDELGEYAWQAAWCLKLGSWRHLVATHWGHPNIPSSVGQLPHRPAHFLGHLHSMGHPIILQSAPWPTAKLNAVVTQRPHPPVCENTIFLWEEMLEMCQWGQWVVLPYSVVRACKGLHISLPGIIPQWDRHPQTIIDYTWLGINADTIGMAPPESMQFGHTFWCLLHAIYFANPHWGPVHLLKANITDGFYQVWIATDDVQKLGLILPGGDPANPDITFLLALPMGWVKSPPAFCAITKTTADLANAVITTSTNPSPH